MIKASFRIGLMMQKKNIFNVFVACAVLGLAADQAVAASVSKPNVLFIAIDDMNDWTTLTADSTIEQVVWQGDSDLSALAGTPVCFRFELTEGSLYSF